jgi:hypothetical protein
VTYPWLPAAAAALLAGGAAPGALQGILNDEQIHRSGSRPFLVLGDPACAPPPAATEGEAGSIELPAGAVAQIDRRIAHDAIELDGAGPEATLVRGAGRLTVLRDAAAPPATVRIADRGAELAELAAALPSLVARLAAAQRVRDVAQALLPEPRHAGAAALLAELDAVRERLAAALRAGAHHVDEIRARGVWLPTAGALAGLFDACERLWAQRMAELLGAHDLIQVDPERLLLDGTLVAERSAAGRCEVCGCETTRTLHAPVEPVAPRQALLTCPTCGVQGIWEEGGGGLQVDLDPTLTPGHTAELAVTLPDDGFLAIQLKDNGSDRIAHRAVLAAQAGRTVLPLPVPADSAPEVHTLRVAWTHGLGVACARVRRPCVPPDRERS